ncbi:hypothetical protein V6N13_084278 [Hibiscus sabdariffa]
MHGYGTCTADPMGYSDEISRETVPVTVKVDVYSFGVLLLEIIWCRRNVAMDVGEEEKAILTDWACNCFSEGTVDALVENDAEALSDRMKLERFVMVALWCIQAHHEESSADA